MSSYYEEKIPVAVNVDKYLQYYLDESTPLFDQLNQILKKGQPFQKKALVSKLANYIDNGLFKSLLIFIISNIEIWDNTVIMEFPKSLYEIIKKQKNEEIFNIIIKHMIIAISTFDESVSNEYVYYFDKIINFLTENKIYNIDINNDIIELIIRRHYNICLY